MNASAERFHGDAEWAALPEEVRRELGVALLQHAVAGRGADTASSEREERPFLAAAGIIEARVEELLAEELWGTLIPDDRVPPVPAMLGRYCRRCGCSDYDACGGFRRAVRLGRGRPLHALCACPSRAMGVVGAPARRRHRLRRIPRDVVGALRRAAAPS